MLILPALGFLLLHLASRRNDPPQPAESALISQQFLVEGKAYSVVDGNAWKRSDSGGWTFIEQLYEPDFFEKNYAVKDGRTFRKDPGSGKMYEMRKTFKSGFEDAATIRELIGETQGWTAFTLQSPQSSSIPDYVALRTAILKGEGTFLDNRIEPSTELAHSGKSSLRTFSVAPGSGMVTAKASLETEFLHFTKGDDYWFSGWFYVKSGMPFTLMDIESAWLNEHPGMRIMIDNGALLLEMKWADKPRYVQSAPLVKFPSGKWVRVKTHLKLSEKEDGVIELWQDEKQIVSAKGRTLPLADTIYNSLEVGISATSQEATLFVDDVEVSDKEIK